MRLRASSIGRRFSPAETRYFEGLELAPRAGLEPFERQTRVHAAVQARDGIPDCLEHPANLSVPTLVERQLDARLCQAPDSGRSRHAVFELDSFGQGLEYVFVRTAVDVGDVHLLHPVTRMREPVRERAVVREQQRSGGIDVQPAD